MGAALDASGLPHLVRLEKRLEAVLCSSCSKIIDEDDLCFAVYDDAPYQTRTRILCMRCPVPSYGSHNYQLADTLVMAAECECAYCGVRMTQGKPCFEYRPYVPERNLQFCRECPRPSPSTHRVSPVSSTAGNRAASKPKKPHNSTRASNITDLSEFTEYDEYAPIEGNCDSCGRRLRFGEPVRAYYRTPKVKGVCHPRADRLICLTCGFLRALYNCIPGVTNAWILKPRGERSSQQEPSKTTAKPTEASSNTALSIIIAAVFIAGILWICSVMAPDTSKMTDEEYESYERYQDQMERRYPRP